MSAKGGKTVVYLHSESPASERRNQLALIENQLFVDAQDDDSTGDITVESNKISNQVRYIAKALMVLKRDNLPMKEVFVKFLSTKSPCKLQDEERAELCEALETCGQEVPKFAQFETPPSKTASRNKIGETSVLTGVKSVERPKERSEEQSGSDSSDSDEPDRKKSPLAEVSVTSKTQRAKSILSRLKEKSSKPQAQAQEINIEEELKRLGPSLSKLDRQEWIAIGEFFVDTKASLNEQKKTELIMRAVDSKLHTWFRGGQSQLAASHLMIDLYENCYGRGESAIKAQRQNVEALTRALK